jgi:hypothetical protein
MDTMQSIPKEDYLQRCVNGTAVRRFLETSRYHKHLYVITGTKIVSGAQGATKTSRALDGKVGAHVDGTIVSGGMVPVGGGPEVRRGRATKTAVAWEGSSDFVFAYKVSEVQVNKLGEVTREREYTKGAMYEDAVAKREPGPLGVVLVDGTNMQTQDGLSAEAVVEGKEVVTYGIPVPVGEDSDQLPPAHMSGLRKELVTASTSIPKNVSGCQLRCRYE